MTREAPMRPSITTRMGASATFGMDCVNTSRG